MTVAVSLTALPVGASEAKGAEGEKEGFNIKEIIFHHLGDGYGWEVPFLHDARIPLPVIVRAQSGKWYCFSSARLTKHEEVEVDGKKKGELLPVIYTAEDGTRFMLGNASSGYENKVLELLPVAADKQVELFSEAEALAKKNSLEESEVIIPDYMQTGGVYYQVYRPFDMSVTKNVLALWIAVVLVVWYVMAIKKFYSRRAMKAPRKGMGFLELVIDFVYTGVIKATLGAKAPKFAPYLLTAFFFILTMNLLGLIVIFPGGANLTGNIAVTLVLALLTFVITNVLGTKHYWKEIFWPDVPLWLKCPLPIMQFIEVFGIFTKPAALCIRLFANMMGGHMIVLTLVCLIFIFGAYGAAVAGGTAVVSVLFTIFMLALDVLVSFIQAYVFTMLSTMFIAAAQEDGHHHKAELKDGNEIEVPAAVEA